MWIKLDVIRKFIPDDDKYHDIQIVNNKLFVDGEIKDPSQDYSAISFNFDNITVSFDGNKINLFDRALNEKEVKKLYKKAKGDQKDEKENRRKR